MPGDVVGGRFATTGMCFMSGKWTIVSVGDSG